MFDRAYVAFCPERGGLVSVACRPVTGQRPSCRVRHFAMHADKGDENENYTGVVSTSRVRQLMSLGGFLSFDFGSSFGTISHGVHRFFETVARAPGCLQKTLIVSAGPNLCARRATRCAVQVSTDPTPAPGSQPPKTCSRPRASLTVATTSDIRARVVGTLPIGTSSAIGRSMTWGISTCGVRGICW